jgi:predicted secreted protein
MKIQSMIAIYFVIWWITLFAVLPFGVKNASETGEMVEEGHDAGAPVFHGLWKKAAVNTVIAAVVFAGVYWAYVNGMIG